MNDALIFAFMVQEANCRVKFEKLLSEAAIEILKSAVSYDNDEQEECSKVAIAKLEEANRVLEEFISTLE